MEIIFLGTSHGVPEQNQFCSSTLIRIGQNSYLIDAGAPISPLLCRYGVPHSDIRGIFVTHLHGDHFDGLAEFCDQLTWFYRDADPRILLPEQAGIDLLHMWVKGMQGERYTRKLRLETYEEGLIYDDGCLRVTARRTRHTETSYAFVLESEGKRLLFTGDLSRGYDEYPALLRGEAYDLVVCEAAHHPTYDCYDLFAQTKTKRMLINHIAPTKRARAEQLIGRFPFEFGLAYDGMRLEI